MFNFFPKEILTKPKQKPLRKDHFSIDFLTQVRLAGPAETTDIVPRPLILCLDPFPDTGAFCPTGLLAGHSRAQH